MESTSKMDQDHNVENRQDPCETLNDHAYSMSNKEKYHGVKDKDSHKHTDPLREVDIHS
jgi:hypothetical protein